MFLNKEFPKLGILFHHAKHHIVSIVNYLANFFFVKSYNILCIYCIIYIVRITVRNSSTNIPNRSYKWTFEMEIRRIKKRNKSPKIMFGLEFTRMHALYDYGLFARNIGGCFICRSKAFRWSAGSKAEILAARKYERKLDLR